MNERGKTKNVYEGNNAEKPKREPAPAPKPINIRFALLPLSMDMNSPMINKFPRLKAPKPSLVDRFLDVALLTLCIYEAIKGTIIF